MTLFLVAEDFPLYIEQKKFNRQAVLCVFVGISLYSRLDLLQGNICMKETKIDGIIIYT